MKRITLVLLLFWVLLPCSQAMSVSLSLQAESETIFLGDDVTFFLNISGLNADGPDSLGAFSLTLLYDPAVLFFSSVAFGNKLGDPDEVDTYYNEETKGSIWLDSTSWLFEDELDALQPADFTLASLTFAGIGIGSTWLTMENVVLSDAAFPPNEIFADTLHTASVTVVPVPEPATLLLLAAGMGGLGLVRRRWVSAGRGKGCV